MIAFQTTTWQVDLTDKGISFTENSEYFSDSISKNFSFPFYVYMHEDIAEKLGLINISNVRSYKSKIDGYLIIDGNFYDAYISLNEIKGDRAELTIFYGKETLTVFDKKLSLLPFPVVSTGGSLPTFAKTQITKEWPEATHNFVKVFRDGLKKNANYEYFEGFLNNYVADEFPINTIDIIETENVSINRNIMVPMTYLLEILKVAFASEGYQIRGDFVNDDFNKKIVYVPKNYFEHFYVSQFENYSFSTATSQETVNGKTVNVYKHIHTPTTEGSFSLKMKVNMSDAIAKYFKLKVIQNGVTLYEAFSENNQVALDETLDINIVNTTIFDDIEVELRLLSQENSIAAYNSFTYEYKEGQLNVFPTTYTIADFMPDMTFREFINEIKSWLNIKFDYTHNAVYINYLEKLTDSLVFSDHSHLQQVDPARTLNSNNLFKLTYPDGQEVLVSKTGQTYDETEYVDTEIEKMDIKILPLTVGSNNNSITAIYPSKEEDLMFLLYNGPIGGEPLATDAINNRKLTLQHIYNNNWKNWLRFRANSETYKDTFFMHVTEKLAIKEGIFKYNKNHLIKSIQKKRINSEYWQVTIETETF